MIDTGMVNRAAPCLPAFTQDCDYDVRFLGQGIFSQKGLATSTLTGRGPDACVAVLSDATPLC